MRQTGTCRGWPAVPTGLTAGRTISGHMGLSYDGIPKAGTVVPDPRDSILSMGGPKPHTSHTGGTTHVLVKHIRMLCNRSAVAADFSKRQSPFAEARRSIHRQSWWKYDDIDRTDEPRQAGVRPAGPATEAARRFCRRTEDASLPLRPLRTFCPSRHPVLRPGLLYCRTIAHKARDKQRMWAPHPTA